MLSASLQERLREGEEAAFRGLYAAYAGELYRSAKAALKEEAAAREVVKQVILSLHRAICESDTPVDTDRLTEDFSREAINRALWAAHGASHRAPRRLTDAPAASAADAAPRHIGATSEKTDPTDPAEAPKATPSVGAIVAGALIGLFLIAALWALCGMLMALNILPKADLGYTFFDTHIFPLFLLN